MIGSSGSNAFAWRSLTDTQTGDIPPGRSSHSCVVVESKLAVFGGEDEPRHPINNSVYLFDIAESKWTSFSAPTDSAAPLARVGHAAASVGSKMFVFGGRTGVDQSETSLGDFWEFDLGASRWLQHQKSSVPCMRSYHSMVSLGNRVFVFGGCGSNGRLNDLQSYDVTSGKWETHQSASDTAGPSIRGGPAVFAYDAKIYIFGGFNGKELGDFHVYDLVAGRWAHPQINGDVVPTPRSVALAASLSDGRLFLFGGEVDPSTQGHAGAGMYSNETFVYDIGSASWHKADGSSGGGSDQQTPSPRGWLAGTAYDHPVHQHQVYLFGGFTGEKRTNELFVWEKK
jgi:N-acetylneuraminic acid mutarotase